MFRSDSWIASIKTVIFTFALIIPNQSFSQDYAPMGSIATGDTNAELNSLVTFTEGAFVGGGANFRYRVSDGIYTDAINIKNLPDKELALNYSNASNGKILKGLRIWNNTIYDEQYEYIAIRQGSRMATFSVDIHHIDANGNAVVTTKGPFNAGFLNPREDALNSYSTFDLGGNYANVSSLVFKNYASENGATNIYVREIQGFFGDIENDYETDITVATTNNPLQPGDMVTYTITVKNNNPTYYGKNISLTSLLPPELSATTGHGVASSGTYDTTTGVWNIPGISAGGSVTLTLVGTIPPNFEGVITATTTAAFGEENIDPDTSTDTLSVDVNVGAPDKITVTKTASPNSGVAAGDTISYTYLVKNEGGRAITDISLSDSHIAAETTILIPTHVTSTLIDTVPVGDSTDTDGDDANWETLGPGDSIEFTASYVVTVDDIEQLQ